MILITDIKDAVALAYGVPAGSMSERIRDAEHVVPRQVAMCLAARLTDRSDNRIGHCFSRDAKTVRHARLSIERRRVSDDKMSDVLRAVTKELLQPRSLI